MTSVIVLAQAGSAANWVAAIGQVLGAIGIFAAVVVALRLARRDRDRETAMQLAHGAAQAINVQIEERSSGEVKVTNDGDHPVYKVGVERVDETIPWTAGRPPDGIYDAEVLLPKSTLYVPHEGYIDRDDVTISFRDMFGRQWRRTGNWTPSTSPPRPAK